MSDWAKEKEKVLKRTKLYDGACKVLQEHNLPIDLLKEREILGWRFIRDCMKNKDYDLLRHITLAYKPPFVEDYAEYIDLEMAKMFNKTAFQDEDSHIDLQKAWTWFHSSQFELIEYLFDFIKWDDTYIDYDESFDEFVRQSERHRKQQENPESTEEKQKIKKLFEWGMDTYYVELSTELCTPEWESFVLTTKNNHAGQIHDLLYAHLPKEISSIVFKYSRALPSWPS